MNQNYTKTTVFYKQKVLFSLFCFILLAISSYGQTSTYSTAGTYSFVVPVGVTSVNIEAWGGGAGAASSGTRYAGGGGAYAGGTYTVVSGTSYSVIVGAGGVAGNSSVGGESKFGSVITAKGAVGGVGGLASSSIGTIKFSGGNGGAINGTAGNGGGGSGGSGGAGGTGQGSVGTTGGLGGTAGAASGTGSAGAAGGAGGSNSGVINGTVGSSPGGGGGEQGLGGASGAGAAGKVIISYSCPAPGTITQPSYICSGSTGNVFSISAVSGATSYTWSVTGTAWAITSGGTTASATITIGSGTGTVSVTATTPCGTSSASTTGSIAVTASNTVSVASSSPTVCANSAMTTITHTTTGATGIGTATGLPTGVSASFSSNTISISGTPTVSGTFTYSIPLTGGCSSGVSATGTITVNAVVAAPTIGTITQPTCGTTTGSVVLTGLPSSGTWTLNRVGASNSTTTGTGTSTTITGLDLGNYTFSVSYGGCTSVASTSVFISSINRWDGTSWDNGVPNSDQRLIFNANYNSTGDLEGCTCQVNTGYTVNINSGHTLTLARGLSVVGTASLIFSDSASLVQVDNGMNSGNITYQRTTNSVRATDYVYWSSPVVSQDLTTLFATIPELIYSYNSNIGDWIQVSSGTLMETALGYIVRSSNSISETPEPTTTFTASFVGVPNNGDVSISASYADKDYLVGNPYPSAISADAFLTANSGVLNGTLYFWTHNTGIQLASNITDGSAGSGAYAYTSNDYATYNTTGGVQASSGGVKPNGYIAVGQGFFASSLLSPTASAIVFSNSMRAAGGTVLIDGSEVNGQFFKTSNTTSKTVTGTEKSRIWLNLTNTQGAFKQTLIGYITDATNGFDTRFDGASYDGNDYIDFYSINENKNLAIQGRALPFDVNDEVFLGYRTTIDGDFTISIDEADGSLVNQTVYLEDKLTNTIFDLKVGDYTFTTTAGTFEDRFVLVYKNSESLSATDFDTTTNSVVISNKNDKIMVNSYSETLDQILVYDLLGRQLYQVKDVNSNIYSITNLGSHQTLLIKVILENGTIVTKKIVY